MSITSFERMLNLYQMSIDYKIFNNTRYTEIPNIFKFRIFNK